MAPTLVASSGCLSLAAPAGRLRRAGGGAPLPPTVRLAAAPHRRQARRQRARNSAVARTQAALYQLPFEVADSLRTAAGASFALALAVSALSILTGDSKERNAARSAAPSEADSSANFRWSVMAVISLIPFVNPMAWVFAALDDEDSSALYYTFAFLYALPYLASGLELDGFALLSVALGVAHVQLERVAMTEPAEVEVPAVLRAALRALPAALRRASALGAALGGEVEGRVRSARGAQARRPDRAYLEERSAQARLELEEFDRRAAQRRSEEEARRRAQEEGGGRERRR